MKLYIETDGNQIKNHPAFEENLVQAFGLIPSHWVSFERIPMPEIGTYQVYEGVTYEWFYGVVKDFHHVREMTAEEKETTDKEIEEAKKLLNL
jgi:hypothetical protein